MSGTRRQLAIRRAIRALVPLAPLAEVEPAAERAAGRGLKTLPPSVAAWLALVAHVRHAHTDYDALLDEGYERDAARFFVADEIDRVLTAWGCRRAFDPDEDQSG